MIEIKNLNKYFGSNHAVKNVNITIQESEMIGIIGRSGAGKSTLLRIMNRLTEESSGEIIVDGQDITKLNKKDKRAWQKSCAMIFQQFNLVPRLDVLTNVVLGRLNVQPTFKGALKLFTKEERIDALLALDELGMSQTALPVSYTHLTLPTNREV